MITNLLKVYRIKAGLSQKEVAAALNISQGAVSAWELGRNNLNPEMAEKLAKLYRISSDRLIGSQRQSVLWDPKKEEQRDVPDETGSHHILTTLRNYERNQEVTHFVICEISITPEYKKEIGSDIRIIEAVGNSMIPTICPGDQLICIMDDFWQSGDIVLIDINDSKTIKRIFLNKDGGINLVPDNKKFKAMHYSPEEIENLQIHILGRIAKVIGPDLL